MAFRRFLPIMKTMQDLVVSKNFEELAKISVDAARSAESIKLRVIEWYNVPHYLNIIY